MTFRKLVGKLHLWLGLGSGLVVFIVSVTGCVYVFQDNIYEATHRELVRVAAPAAGARPIGYSRAWQRAQQALGPRQPLVYGTAYRDPSRTWVFMAYKFNAGGYYFGHLMDYYQTVYVNPYTGRVTGVVDTRREFFQAVKWLHWGLWLGHAGELLVGCSTLIFVLMVLSGLVLWWPRNRAARKQRFQIKWDASGKRLNYDLHSAVGFYVTLVSLAIALTGLTWSFEWVQAGVRYLAVGAAPAAAAAPALAPPPPLTPAEQPLAARRLDEAVREAWWRVPAAASVSGAPLTSLGGQLALTANEETGTFYRTDQLTFDARSGAFQQLAPYQAKSAGNKFLGMNYDLHVGGILGWPTKVLAFAASLLCATLPVTGFLVWWNRLKRNKRPHRQPRPVASAA